MGKTKSKKHDVVETYMNNDQLSEFRALLKEMLSECNEEARSVMQAIRECDGRASDAVDNSDIIQRLEEARHLLSRLSAKKAEIEAALSRIDSGDYGYCEDTGEEIGLDRLRANPLARLCIEAANRQERLLRMRG